MSLNIDQNEVLLNLLMVNCGIEKSIVMILMFKYKILDIVAAHAGMRINKVNSIK